jgi:hypothetical protein
LPDVFTLFISDIPDVVSVIQRVQDDTSGVLLLFYGIDVLSSSPLGDRHIQLVRPILDEPWNWGLFDEWCNFALRFPTTLNGKQCLVRIQELLKNGDLTSRPLVQFATILEATGSPGEAFGLYPKARDGRGVLRLLPNSVAYAAGVLPELLGLCAKCGNTEVTRSVMGVLSEHPQAVKPPQVVAALMFDWDLIEAYFHAFERPPTVVLNAYITTLVIYHRPKLQGFLDSCGNYDWKMVGDSLLKFGCLQEFASVLRRFDVRKYLEFLVIKEDWKTPFDVLQNNRALVPFVLKMMIFDETYFVEFVKHVPELELTMSDIVGKIPKDCPPGMLVDRFRCMASALAAKNTAEQLVDVICRSEAFDMFEECMRQKAQGVQVDLA